ncbi:biotin/lipoyl-containing protein [Zunongwangia sp. F363]|uniref:Biotin/lipoyl-containing protein n=1 Tax=Autumnicola tepida TaxID=3075595 RepID=A0ABU3CC82_9FLAO|nr:biotin/lipoyl-containing protein [Zunongwangia sp. F363]MDT0643944.1 biotin/lipoyl-containing protein [Zunongwangia sp. F363]
MEKKYKVKVNDSYEFEFTSEEIEAIDKQQVSESRFHVLQDNRSFKAEILNSDFNQKKYTVKINSNVYEVDIANELDLLIEAMGLSLSSAQLVNDIKAPMPGLILDVNVKEGDEVKEGDYLLVLEAMKMENTLTAPGDGVIKAVHVQKGQGVEKNQLLIELE